MKKIKIFIYSFSLYLLNHFITYLPSHSIRIFAMKLYGVKVGRSNFLRMYLKFLNPKNIRLGNNNSINQKVMFDGSGGKVIIGNNVDVGYETNIWTLEHDPDSDTHDTVPGDVIIEDYVWIASRVTILPGVKIEKGAVVASGSIVTKNVASMTIVAGVPAKVIGYRKSGLKYNPSKRGFFR